jgi:cation diffusion facilitator family transporter
MNLQQTKKVSIARLSIISNITLMIFKLITGLVIGSVSIISEAIHSGVDLLAAIIAYVAVKTSGKPADQDHPFGHGKIENISGTIEALLIFLAAGWIIYEAVKKIISPTPIEALSWGVGVMLFSSIINWIVSHMLFTVGEETDSIALKADAWHLRTDVYTSVGVMFGLSIIWIGQYFFPDLSLQWIDPIAALAVAFLIIRTAFQLTIQSARDLMDTKLPTEEENYIRNLIASMYPKVHGYHRLRTRKAGSNRFIEFHMKVAPDMTVEDSHTITHEIKQQIVEHFSESSVTIHVEPCDGKCQSDCLKHCLLSKEEQKKVRRQTDFQKQ